MIEELQKESIIKLLRKNFPTMSGKLIDELAEIGTIKSFNPGDVLMRKGQYFQHTILILDGIVKLYREDDEGREFLMYYLHNGDSCALSMICAAKNEASQLMAIVDVPTTALMIPIDKMDLLMTEHKTWYYYVLETYRKRFDEVLTALDNIAFRNMDERLEWYLKREQEQRGTHTLHITHQVIAEDLATSREVISRLLKRMEELGKVELRRNEIIIKE
jgi:CRP/FNR family transcriptional regulator